MKVLVATGNRGKLREVQAFLAGEGVEGFGLDQVPGAPEVEEDADTFLANARKKARALAAFSGVPTLADDSGLAVAALGGRPGVHSARYAGPGASDRANNEKLLAELSGVPEGQRQAAFVCALVLALPEGEEIVAEGRLEGRIVRRPRGSGGFGYDPLFWVEGEGCTLAEMDLPRKNRLSHRGRALRALAPRLAAALTGSAPGR